MNPRSFGIIPSGTIGKKKSYLSYEQCIKEMRDWSMLYARVSMAEDVLEQYALYDRVQSDGTIVSFEIRCT